VLDRGVDWYKNVTETMLCKYGDLGFLLLVRHKTETGADWPSWVFQLYRRRRGTLFHEGWNVRTNLPASVSKTASFGRDCINIQGIRVGNIEECYKTRNMDDMQRLFCTLRDQRGAEVMAWTATESIGFSKGVLCGSSPDTS
jgi:hypothetical protein